MNTYPAWAWAAFAGGLLTCLSLDLYVHRGDRCQDRRCAILWSLVWLTAGVGFGGLVWLNFGSEAATEYYAAYLVEESLSVDNLFVFLLIFRALGIEHRHQRKVLTWGIFGALVMRGLFVTLGVAALRSIHWMTQVFGAILLWAAVRTWRSDPAKQTGSALVDWLQTRIPATRSTAEGRFVLQRQGRRVVTPLLIAAIALELTDVLFAFDSVPAAFSVTRDTFLLYSSNAFAVLGLRSLYALLAEGLQRLRYLHLGLAVVLGLAGIKLMISEWVTVSAPVSIGVIAGVLAGVIVLSLRQDRDPSAH